jgi:hypothetical protein
MIQRMRGAVLGSVVGTLAGLFSAVLALAPVEGHEVAVFTVPWSSEHDLHRVAAQTGAQVVAVGGYGRLAILRSSQPDFIGRLYTAGAWLILDGSIVSNCISMKARVATSPKASSQA